VSDLVVSIASGELRGAHLAGEDVDAFRGVPYAAAPSSELRWAAPEVPAVWTGVRDATAPGPVCPQPARPFSQWAHGPLPPTDEDSLTLNVWRPAGSAPSGGRPIVVFLHGGGWALGWGSNPLLDGRHLARALDAVVVTLNYRLGSLGWLWHPALAEDSAAPCGNWGTLDQLAALRWVAAHAAAFGGDRRRVTLAGESAGAGSVLHQLITPAASDLFTRAIALSPPLHELVVDSDRGGRWAQALCDHLGLGDDVSAALPRLRGLPAGAIVVAQEELLGAQFAGTRGGAMPIVDPASLPADPAAVPDARLEVPLLVGTSADEGTFFFRAGGRRVDPEPDRMEAMVARLAHSRRPGETIERTRDRLRAAGRPASPNDVLCAVVTEAWFAAPVKRYAAERAAAGGQVHRYRIDHRSAEDDLGAVHSLSVPLAFGSWREGGVAARLAGTGPGTAAVTEAIADDWRRFIHGDLLGWEPVRSAPTAATPLVVYGGMDGPRSLATTDL
jgi:para-nitrobenzyl esterase